MVRDFYSTNPIRGYTKNTITDVDELLLDLGRIRERGYAVDEVEHEPDVKCVAAPVWNHREAVVGAISVSGPEKRMDHLITESNLVENLRAAADEASGRMGCSGVTMVRP
jgi:DNA-binding IclR family transcriptional regulator